MDWPVVVVAVCLGLFVAGLAQLFLLLRFRSWPKWVVIGTAAFFALGVLTGPHASAQGAVAACLWTWNIICAVGLCVLYVAWAANGEGAPPCSVCGRRVHGRFCDSCGAPRAVDVQPVARAFPVEPITPPTAAAESAAPPRPR
jgi:hypothetical protein